MSWPLGRIYSLGIGRDRGSLEEYTGSFRSRAIVDSAGDVCIGEGLY